MTNKIYALCSRVVSKSDESFPEEEIDFFIKECVIDEPDSCHYYVEEINCGFPVHRGTLIYLVVVRYDEVGKKGFVYNNYFIEGVYFSPEKANLHRELIDSEDFETDSDWFSEYSSIRSVSVQLFRVKGKEDELQCSR